MMYLACVLVPALVVSYLTPSQTIRKYSTLVQFSGMPDLPPEMGYVEGPSDEDREEFEKELVENAPSELEVRLNLLGFTPWTIGGFVLAGVIISLNNVLGYGWASELLGLDSTVPIQITTDGKGGSLGADGSINGNILQLDDKLREAREELMPIEIDDI